jgi:hypothetical protein
MQKSQKKESVSNGNELKMQAAEKRCADNHPLAINLFRTVLMSQNC